MTAGLASAFAPAPAQALVFQFQLDDVRDGLPLDPPIVGSGSFSFDGDPGAGSFALTSLPNYTFSFLFNDGNAFGNADITTPLSEVLVLISQTGNTYNLKLSNINPFGGGGSLGSIDFDNTLSSLSFEPPGLGLNLDLYFSGSYFGNYSATAPVPSATASVPGPLPIFGVASAFYFSRRLRRRINLAKSPVSTDLVAAEQL
ncbi:MAG: hypothetical protein ACI9IO_000418 [Cyanobium sp.]|jgi:hypothetical protein